MVDVRETEKERERFTLNHPRMTAKKLAKRFARGEIRTRDLQHGADDASYHYTTPPPQCFLALTVGARPKEKF